jgi:hypothetical protein
VSRATAPPSVRDPPARRIGDGRASPWQQRANRAGQSAIIDRRRGVLHSRQQGHRVATRYCYIESMPTHRRLSAEHQQTLVAIFRHHDAPARIEWADLLHLMEAVGSVHDKGHGVYQFIVNGEHHEMVRPTHDALTNADEMTAFRKFLERARMTP